AGGVRVFGCAAADAEREGGQKGVAGADGERARCGRRARGATDTAGGGGGGDLAGGAGAGAHQHPRKLLRARRALAPGDEGGGADPFCTGRGAAAADAVRAPDGGGADVAGGGGARGGASGDGGADRGGRGERQGAGVAGA